MVDSRLIMVVDDDEATLHLLVDVLSPAGYTVRACRNGSSALAAIASQRPDLVLLDVVMPHTTGLDVLHQIRQTGLADLPIVLLTARSYTHEDMLAHGANAYLQKPFDIESLLQCVASTLPYAHGQTRINA